MFGIPLAVLCLGLASAAPHIDDSIEEEEALDLDVPEGGIRDGEDHGFNVDGIEIDAAVDDDDGMIDFVAEKLKKAPPPMWFHLDATGKQPLADDWEVQVIAQNDTFMVIQLPVLVAQGRSRFVQEHPGGLRVEVVMRSSDHEIVFNERVTTKSIYDTGPSWLFFHTAVPHTGRSGDVRFLVRTAEIPLPPIPEDAIDPEPVEPPPPPPLKDRYARTTVFMRK